MYVFTTVLFRVTLPTEAGRIIITYNERHTDDVFFFPEVSNWKFHPMSQENSISNSKTRSTSTIEAELSKITSPEKAKHDLSEGVIL